MLILFFLDIVILKGYVNFWGNMYVFIQGLGKESGSILGRKRESLVNKFSDCVIDKPKWNPKGKINFESLHLVAVKPSPYVQI